MSYRPDSWKFNASLPTDNPERATQVMNEERSVAPGRFDRRRHRLPAVGPGIFKSL